MQDMIKKIIQMDKDARRLNEEALQRKADSAQAAAAKRQEVFDSYLLMARNRIDTIRKVEMQNAEEQIKAIDERSRTAAEKLRSRLEEYREQWVADIVTAVTEGEDLK